MPWDVSCDPEFNSPWSAAALIEMISKAWTSTLIENVYIAKLAVLMSVPRKFIIHCTVSARVDRLRIGKEEFAEAAASKEGVQDLDLSESSTPWSRASCSSVIGINDPIPQMTKTFIPLWSIMCQWAL